MRHATRRRSTPIRPAIPIVSFLAVSALAFVGCLPAPTATPAVQPSGGPATFRPTPTPVPGSSEIPSEPTGGTGPQPSIQVPPPIP